jgi:hypothetical protein
MESVMGEVVCTPRAVTVPDGLIQVESMLDPAKSIIESARGEVVCTSQVVTTIEMASGDNTILDNSDSPEPPSVKETVRGEVVCTPLAGNLPDMGPDNRKSFVTVNSRFPQEVQVDIADRGKANRARIQERVNSLLLRHNIVPSQLQRLAHRGNLLIKAPDCMRKLPFWGFRASGILPQHLMDGVLNCMAEAEAAGCKPHINPLKKAQAQARKRERNGLPPLSTGGSRSDYEVPFHIGVFKHPSRVFTQPWITRDTLQGLSGDGQLRERRMGKMMALCKSLDNLVNGRVQRLLSRIAPDVLVQFREFARLRAASKEVVQHDMRQHPLPPHLERFDSRWPFLRFGNLGTTVAIGRGQSEKLHLDVHDDEELPTILMVLGRKDQDWDHSEGQGDIMLPTLGFSIPLYPGDIFIFYASLLPHQVKLLPAEQRHKRTVATLFTCSPTRIHLESKRKLQDRHEQDASSKDEDEGEVSESKKRRVDVEPEADSALFL